jgi:hypothetical protein
LTPAKLNARLKHYDALIARWGEMLREGKDDTLALDIADLKAWRNRITPVANVGVDYRHGNAKRKEWRGPRQEGSERVGEDDG